MAPRTSHQNNKQSQKTDNMFKNQDEQNTSKNNFGLGFTTCNQSIQIKKLISIDSVQKNSFKPNYQQIELIKLFLDVELTKKLKMNTKSIFKSLVFCLSFLLSTLNTNAQTTVVTGPSDKTSAPPASGSVVNQVIKAGDNISLKIGNSNTTATDIIYQWYKIDNAGVKQLVQSSSSSTFSEASTEPGYYVYQLLISNSNQCTSEISDPFKVYALPALNPAIAASSGTICSNGTSTSVLTANPGDSKYSYQYQWALNGTDISGATAATYTTPAASTNGSNTYLVKVAYTLSPSIIGTATQVVNVIPVPGKPAITVGR